MCLEGHSDTSQYKQTALVWSQEATAVLTILQNLKLLDNVDMEDQGKPGKITDDSRCWKLTRADPLKRIEWRKNLRANIGTMRPTLSGNVT